MVYGYTLFAGAGGGRRRDNFVLAATGLGVLYFALQSAETTAAHSTSALRLCSLTRVRVLAPCLIFYLNRTFFLLSCLLRQVSAGGACAGGWVSNEFPDSFPFHCGDSVNNGQRANMYGCNVGPLAHSGYTPGADDEVCGCPDWVGVGIQAPAISDCVGVNKEWVALAMPWAQHLKKACPTAYTFPYDDQTSTFMCADGDTSVDGFVNTQSCEFCFFGGGEVEGVAAVDQSRGAWCCVIFVALLGLHMLTMVFIGVCVVQYHIIRVGETLFG